MSQQFVACEFCGKAVERGNVTHDGKPWCGCANTFTNRDDLRDELQRRLEVWHAKNRGSSVIRQGPEFERMVELGRAAVPHALNILRGNPTWILFQLIRRHEGEVVTLEPDERGRLTAINKKYLAWGEAAYPPSAADYFDSALLAQRAGEFHFASVVAPDRSANYSRSYFVGSLAAARKDFAVAAELRERAIAVRGELTDLDANQTDKAGTRQGIREE